MAQVPVTLNNPEGHFSRLTLFNSSVDGETSADGSVAAKYWNRLDSSISTAYI